MPETPIPPCGPAWDRLVAEAVGWDEVSDGLGGTLWVDAANKPTGYYSPNAMGKAGRPFRPSQSDADALAALKAWKEQEIGRHVTVDIGHCVHVCLYEPDRFSAFGQAPTLRDAATAALVRWRNERSQA